MRTLPVAYSRTYVSSSPISSPSFKNQAASSILPSSLSIPLVFYSFFLVTFLHCLLPASPLSFIPDRCWREVPSERSEAEKGRHQPAAGLHFLSLPQILPCLVLSSLLFYFSFFCLLLPRPFSFASLFSSSRFFFSCPIHQPRCLIDITFPLIFPCPPVPLRTLPNSPILTSGSPSRYRLEGSSTKSRPRPKFDIELDLSTHLRLQQ